MSIVRNDRGEVVGIWIADEEKARNDPMHVVAALMLEDRLEHRNKVDFFVRIKTGDYKVVPNTQGDAGGCFVIFESGLHGILRKPTAFGAALNGTFAQLTSPDESQPSSRAVSLKCAAEQGDISAVHDLLAQGVDVNAADADGETPLRKAAMKGHSEITEMLLEHGASVDAATREGWTALHGASWNGNPRVAQVLISKGANLGARNRDGVTPLHGAAKQGHRDLVKLFLDRGSDPNVATDNGVTPLHLAAFEGHADVVSELLRRGAEPNATREDRATPLHQSAFKGYRDVVVLLLQAGADPTLFTEPGKLTAAQAATAGGYPEIAQLIADYGRPKGGIEEARQSERTPWWRFWRK